jgi:agmatine deiminase
VEGQQMTEPPSTPREDGFSMPAEWERHEACLMEWPTVTRKAFWGDRFDEAERDYAAVANAIAAFEPVVMVCDPEQTADVRRRCGEGVEALPLPIDDSWMRDNGPIFVRDRDGRVALVHFRFNSWGEKYLPYDRDAEVPRHIASHLGMRRYEAPFVLEGGSFFVDGEGTLITTEQCLLNPNRNPSMSREKIEQGLRSYLGVEAIVWLGLGHSTDRDTDGHIDGIAPYLAPATVALLVPADPDDPDHERGLDNLDRLRRSRDARGRTFEVIAFETRPPGVVPFLNFYLANGGAIVPIADRAESEQADEQALEQIAKMLPDREIVPVQGDCLNFGGGGPHCITQQRPAGVVAPA